MGIKINQTEEDYKAPTLAEADKRREEIRESLDIEQDNSGLIKSIYKRIPTNVRLLLENLVGVEDPITEKDFTKDELVEMIFLAEMTDRRNKAQEFMLKDMIEINKSISEKVTDPDKALKYADMASEYQQKLDTYEDTRGKTSVHPYDNAMRSVPGYGFSTDVDESYIGSIVNTISNPRYRVATSLGKYNAFTEDGIVARKIKDRYNFNPAERNLPKNFVSVIKNMMYSPELAGEYLANFLKTEERKVDIDLPRKKSVEMAEGGLSLAEQTAKFGAEFIPGVGEAMAVKRVSDAMDKKDYVGAGIETAAGALGLVPIVGDVAGKALRATTKTLRKDAKLTIDNPGYDEVYKRTYAEVKQESADKVKEKALKRGETNTYESNIGTADGITGYANKVKFKPEELKDLPGTMGEEKFRSSGEKLQRLKKDIKEKGYKEDPIMIHVREDGQPFIVEGNHRLAEALESGRDTITADIRYLRGAEEKEGLLDPRNIFPDKIKMAEGGVPMKKQMELFDDGGLKDEGGTIDPISGNEVPTGSTQIEVRDDIPAQLSEGEFVFPADVVRYIGLEKLMQMRQEAKRGLEMMDKMGQMGNADEAVIPDDIPFELSDLDMEDEPVEMQQGGIAGVSTMPSQLPSTSAIQQPEMPVAPTVGDYKPPVQQDIPTTTYEGTSFPSIVQTPEQETRVIDIVNPTTGERRKITFIPGVTQLPEGFVLASEYTPPEQTKVTPVTGDTAVSTAAQDKKDELQREKMRADAEAAQARKAIIAELFGEDYLNPTNMAKPFDDLFGRLEPGMITTGGYIVGDNNELLNPETGEQEFFGKDGVLIPLGFKDKPKLDTSKEGGVNKRFRDAYLKKQAKDRSFKEVKSGVTAGDVALDKARKKEKDKNKAMIKKSIDTRRLRQETKKESEKKSSSERKKIKKATDAAQKAVANIMKDKEREYNTGGLASKPKSKPKKMRQGGLASKN